MEERALRLLEFHTFLKALQGYAATEVGRGRCLDLRPTTDPAEIESSLREVAEALEFLQQGNELPLGGLLDIKSLLPRARVEGACFLPEELLRVKSTLGASGRVRKFLHRVDRHFHLLKAWGERIPEFHDLHGQLEIALGPRGEILDSASPALAQIRKRIQNVRSRIRQALENLWAQENLRRIFQEEIITLRNERYVVAVKSEFKHQLPGIIHDHSQSRATFFIEPLVSVEDNNELNLLLKDEKEEERRILLALTAEVGNQAESIARAVEIVGHLDLLMAKAKWARDWKATIPVLLPHGEWHLRQARHPLLDSKTAVPIDLHLGKEESTLIISGANAGGKTVALKTLGLLTLMAQSGIPLPVAEGSEVGRIEKIFVDIGDEQSLSANLSTFSAWVSTVSKMIREADRFSLVLLDEVGGGTEPTEGASLTMALLDQLRSQGGKTVVTTHLQLLKAYGAIHKDVVNVSVEFNPETLQPTYRLIYGRPGDSYALLMAEKWGLPRDLIFRAQSYLGEDNRKVGELLQRLDQVQRELEKKIKEYEERMAEAANLQAKAEAMIERATVDREHLLGQVREKTRALLQETHGHLRQIINEFKAKGRTDIHNLRKEIQTEEERLYRSLEEISPPSKDDINRKERICLSVDRKMGKVPRGGGEIQYAIPPAVQRLKLIGLRVEEALPLVDKGIDDAYLAGLREIEIIHGAGTGRLRQAIREFLADHHLVKSFRSGGLGRGGDGVTMVEIGAPSIRSLHSGKGKKVGV
jgi:DNA mismatch repair protein MutS2